MKILPLSDQQKLLRLDFCEYRRKKSALIVNRVRRENPELTLVPDQTRPEQRRYSPKKDPDSG
jgi:hypothetical protein